MVGKSKDPKSTRITVRISTTDLDKLQAEAARKQVTIGEVVRTIIRGVLPPVQAREGEAKAEG